MRRSIIFTTPSIHQVKSLKGVVKMMLLRIPVHKAYCQLIAGVALRHPVFLSKIQEFKKQVNVAKRGLADADRGDVGRFDQTDIDLLPKRLAEIGRRHPSSGTASHNNNLESVLSLGVSVHVHIFLLTWAVAKGPTKRRLDARNTKSYTSEIQRVCLHYRLEKPASCEWNPMLTSLPL